MVLPSPARLPWEIISAPSNACWVANSVVIWVPSRLPPHPESLSQLCRPHQSPSLPIRTTITSCVFSWSRCCLPCPQLSLRTAHLLAIHCCTTPHSCVLCLTDRHFGKISVLVKKSFLVNIFCLRNGAVLLRQLDSPPPYSPTYTKQRVPPSEKDFFSFLFSL